MTTENPDYEPPSLREKLWVALWTLVLFGVPLFLGSRQNGRPVDQRCLCGTPRADR